MPRGLRFPTEEAYATWKKVHHIREVVENGRREVYVPLTNTPQKYPAIEWYCFLVVCLVLGGLGLFFAYWH